MSPGPGAAAAVVRVGDLQDVTQTARILSQRVLVGCPSEVHPSPTPRLIPWEAGQAIRSHLRSVPLGSFCRHTWRVTSWTQHNRLSAGVPRGRRGLACRGAHQQQEALRAHSPPPGTLLPLTCMTDAPQARFIDV